MNDTTQMIFTFGSNELGRHGAGAALAARSHGAIYNQGFGPQGNSFAIPTCAKPINTPNSTITPDRLRYYIYCFILYAKMVQAGEIAEVPADTKFQVTRIGTGLAAWKDAVVAPLFAAAPDNCYFDEAWRSYLGDSKNYWGTYDPLAAKGIDAASTTSDQITE